MSLKVRFRTLFAATVRALSPILIAKQGSVLTFSFDMDALPEGPIGQTGPSGPIGAGYGGTSATSLEIENTTTKVFTTQAGLAYQVGNYVRASSAAGSGNFMEGQISDYTDTSLSIDVTNIGGSGTFDDWTFSIAGVPGDVGVATIEGNNGAFTLDEGLRNDGNVLLPDPPALANCFGGRLTLVSGNPCPTSDVQSEKIWLAPFKGRALPLYSGSHGWKLRRFTSGPTDNVGLEFDMAGSSNWTTDTIHDLFAVDDGDGNLVLASRVWDADMYPVETLIPASDGTIITTGTSAGNTWSNTGNAFDGVNAGGSGNVNPDVCAKCINTSGTESGMVAWIGKQWDTPRTVSRVKLYAPDDNGMRSDEPDGIVLRVDGSKDATNWRIQQLVGANLEVHALHDIPINITNQVPMLATRVGVECGGDPVGAICIVEAEFYEWIAAVAGRRLVRHEGVWVNDEAMTVRLADGTTLDIPQYEGTCLGMYQIDSDGPGSVTCHNEFGSDRKYNLYNFYNQEPVTIQAGNPKTSDTTPLGFTYNLTTHNIYVEMEDDNLFRINVLDGLGERPIKARLIRGPFLNCLEDGATVSYECGIGVDTTLAYSGTGYSCNHDTDGQAIGQQGEASLVLKNVVGARTLIGVERRSFTGGILSLFTDIRNTYLEATFWA